MGIRMIVLAAALACGGSATVAAAQEPVRTVPDSGWVNLFTIMRLRDDLADRPGEASLEPRNQAGVMVLDLNVVLPEPFHSRTLVAESYVVLDVNAARQATACQPLRAGTHPELDTFACTHLTGPRGATVIALLSLAPGRRVAGLKWESLTAAAHRERRSEWSGQGTAGVASPPPPPAEAGPPSQAPRRLLRGPVLRADFRDLADRRIREPTFEAELAVNEEGVPTSCRVTRSSGNPLVDERTCALLIERARFTQRIDASGRLIADTVIHPVDLLWILPRESRP